MVLTMLILLVVLVFLLGWITTTIVLLVNRKTRIIGIVMSVVAAGVVLLPLLIYIGLECSRVPSHQDITQHTSPLIEKTIDAAPSSDSNKNRPAWIDAKPQLIGDVYHTSVTVGPYTTRQECDAKLPEELQKAVSRYAEMCLDGQTTEKITLPVEELQNEIVKEEWEEVREYSVGPMTHLYARLEFDRNVKERILAFRRQAEVDHRVLFAAAGVILVLGFLAGLYAYLKISSRPVE